MHHILYSRVSPWLIVAGVIIWLAYSVYAITKGQK